MGAKAVNRGPSGGLAIAALVVLAASILGCGTKQKIPTAAVTGAITVNGKPRAGVVVLFEPEAKIRPSAAETDARGRYSAQFTASQSGVALGPCIVRFSIPDAGGGKNLLPEEFHAKAGENPALRLTIEKQGAVFNYDIAFDGNLPQ
jgi:hypothetical protein